MRKAASAWLVLLAATLLIAPHAAELGAAIGMDASTAEAGPDGPSGGVRLPSVPRMRPDSAHTLLVRGGDYADMPGRSAPGGTLRTWLCPHAVVSLDLPGATSPLAMAQHTALHAAPSRQRFDRGPPPGFHLTIG